MHPLSFILATSLAKTCLALPQFGNGNPNGPGNGGNHEWIPASRINGASRGPCPFLNTAANHGYLPRDGRRISPDQFNRAQIEAINFSPDFANTLTTGMLSKFNRPLDNNFFIDLQQLDNHNVNEHDASISRLDRNQGSTVLVNPGLVQAFLDDNRGAPFLDVRSIARTRNRRDQQSIQSGNPPLDQTLNTIAQGEAALILIAMSDEIGDINAGNVDRLQVPKNRVRTWLLEERFPYNEGFHIPRRQVQTSELGALTGRLTFWEQQQQQGGNVGSGGQNNGGNNGGFGGNNGGFPGGFGGNPGGFGGNPGGFGGNRGGPGGNPGGFGGNSGGFGGNGGHGGHGNGGYGGQPGGGFGGRNDGRGRGYDVNDTAS